jgi:hypothetical protein
MGYKLPLSRIRALNINFYYTRSVFPTCAKVLLHFSREINIQLNQRIPVTQRIPVFHPACRNNHLHIVIF